MACATIGMFLELRHAVSGNNCIQESPRFATIVCIEFVVLLFPRLQKLSSCAMQTAACLVSSWTLPGSGCLKGAFQIMRSTIQEAKSISIVLIRPSHSCVSQNDHSIMMVGIDRGVAWRSPSCAGKKYSCEHRDPVWVRPEAPESLYWDQYCSKQNAYRTRTCNEIC